MSIHRLWAPLRALVLVTSLLLGAQAAWAGQAAPASQAPEVQRATPAQTAAATMPPLLDRELFFGNPEISGAQLSPDGKRIAFLKPWKDTRNIYVKALGGQREVLREAPRRSRAGGHDA